MSASFVRFKNNDGIKLQWPENIQIRKWKEAKNSEQPCPMPKIVISSNCSSISSEHFSLCQVYYFAHRKLAQS